MFVSPDVNAAVHAADVSLINLFVEPKKDLLIGLGLVNCVQPERVQGGAGARVRPLQPVGARVQLHLRRQPHHRRPGRGRGLVRPVIDWCKRQDNVVLGRSGYVDRRLPVGRAEDPRMVLKAITLQRLRCRASRSSTPTSSRSAPPAATPSTHCLLRPGSACSASSRRSTTSPPRCDHKLYTNDLYLHQDRAAAVVRRQKKEPELGLPPALKSPNAGQGRRRCSTPKQEEIEDEDDSRRCGGRTRRTPTARRTPRSSSSPAIDRPPLAVDPVQRRGRTQGADDVQVLPHGVQASPRTRTSTDAVEGAGVHRQRARRDHLRPEVQGVLRRPAARTRRPGRTQRHHPRESPWTDDRMEKVLDKLYDGCEEHAEAHSELLQGDAVAAEQHRRAAVAEDEAEDGGGREEAGRELGVVQVVRPPRVPAPRADGRRRWTRS